ncbi:MAG: SpoIID/LytB domain-containing protein [Desulfobacterales bacterium]|nr:SpoIID/LytB domain-containing protein [Desulfobacterales bacterium]
MFQAFFAYGDYKLEFKRADSFLKNGMYQEAISTYYKISDTSNDKNTKALALLLLGNTYNLYLDQPDAALRQFEYLSNLYPNTPSSEDALFNSAIIFYEIGDYQKAYSYFNNYLNKYPATNIRTKTAILFGEKSKQKISNAFGIYDMIMRVLLKEGVNSLVINSEKNIYVNEKIYICPIKITKSGDFIVINGEKISSKTCQILSQGISTIIDNENFRGSFIIYIDEKGLSIINYVPIEQYLYGVVPKEMSYSFAKHALMAQAIAARTYAFYVKGKSLDKKYDISATTSMQVYGGFNIEKKETNLAVDLTHGQIMVYDGKPIAAYFHSNSGGHTEDAKNVWSANIQYLKGIPDKFSKDILNSAWECKFTLNDIRDKLNSYGFNIKQIKAIKLLDKSKSGRVTKILVTSEKEDIIITGNNFRLAMNPTIIKSLLFKMEKVKDFVVFKGIGYGHGVGMSQWGARKMAEAKYNYKSILGYYYKGIKIITLKSI